MKANWEAYGNILTLILVCLAMIAAAAECCR